MFPAIRPARARHAAAILAVAGTVAAGSAGPAAAQPKDAPAPAASPAQGQTGPLTLNLKPDPKQADWTKVCNKDPNSGNDVCNITRDFVTESGQPVLAVAVFGLTNLSSKQETHVVRLLMPLGMQVQTGVSLAVEGVPASAGKFSLCLAMGCFAEVGIFGPELIAALRKAPTLSVTSENQTRRETTFVVPLAGFGKVYDGAPIDPKLLADQEKKIDALAGKREESARKTEPGKIESGKTGTAPKP
ncbi:invasion associated locus B family protein [Methylobacterium nigriterrae]|uniref:invasion associated locus B family protein n=1 Tax=Methylobacterium nigriterrae TaxID=3127512 RepID=UPI00301355A8